MAKITRKNMKMFGSTSSTNQLGVFGSLAAGTPTYDNTRDPDLIQGLSNYLQGWFGAIVGGSNPAIQDMNSLCYLYAYQLCYLFQAGVAEWNASTTYYAGSIVNDGTGITYVSIQNDNANHALTDTSWWRRAGGPYAVALDPVSTPTYTLTANDNNAIFEVNTANGVQTIALMSSPATNFRFTVKDTGGAASLNNIVIDPPGTASIEGYSSTSNYLCRSDYGIWTFQYDGSGWWLV